MTDIVSDDVLRIAAEVDKICSYFLRPTKISYFQFKRTYKSRPPLILANNPLFFREFLQDERIQSSHSIPLHTRQSYFCFWDETLPDDQLWPLRQSFGIYHGLTILSRRKDFYDCTSFAMAAPHPSPVAHYLFVIKDLQNFSDIFPSKAKHLIQEATKLDLKISPDDRRESQSPFFLPKRSDRFYFSEDPHHYITTYEALCAQLAQQGKSYKEIGTLLSMGSGTVKTHLMRLKARTGLSLQEISLQLLRAYEARNDIFEPDRQGQERKLRVALKKDNQT